ncbi:MAG: hypothetical protein ABWY63_14270 [Hyphomicrobiaceae bacterium]
MAVMIDPTTKTVTDWQPAGPFITAVRAAIGCQQIDSVLLSQGQCLWVDNLGLLQNSQRFFRFKDSPWRWGGRAILTAVDEDGMPCDTGPVDLVGLASRIDWCEGVHVLSIQERLEATPTELGPWPRVVREPVFSEGLKNGPTAPFDVQTVDSPVQPPDLSHAPPHEPQLADLPEQPVMLAKIWTVKSDDELDVYVAREGYRDSTLMTGNTATFGKMADVTSYFAKLGAERLPDDPDDPDEVVARFAAP